MSIGGIWDIIILSPMINILIVLSRYLFSNFGLTIIILTIIIRVAMHPLTMKQLRAQKAMQSVQSQIAELQKKYAKDKQQLATEQMKLYKESGMSPVGCLTPILIQMPIWIALNQSIDRVLATFPEKFLNLSRHLYSSWSLVFSQVPLESKFLWFDLAAVNNLPLAIIVGGTMWVQQKMVTVEISDPKQQVQNERMLWMMPLTFAFVTLSLPSGLALYFIASNVIGIITQYFVTGWGGLATLSIRNITNKKKGRSTQQKALPAKTTTADIAAPSSAQGDKISDEKSGDKRQDSTGSHTTRPRTTRRKPGQSGGRGSKRG